MNETVKPKRKYNSTRRAIQAADTKSAIVAVARILFVNHGWQATTIASIANESGVSSETIYAAFKNKQTILQSVVERAIRGAEPDRPLLEQDGPSAVLAAKGHEQIELFARDITRVLANVAEVMAVARAAAESEPDIAELYAGLHAGRRRHLSAVAQAMLRHGPLKGNLDEAEITSLLWRLASPELFLLMTKVEGLTPEQYGEWLANTLKRVLLQQR
jgi:AcrR family transcriptional regulator